jgi:hypothetical protein
MLAQRAAPEEEELLQARHDTAQREAAPEEEELIQARHDTAQREGAPEEEEELLQARHDTAQRAAPEEEDELLQASHDTAQRESVPEVGVEGGPVSNGLASRIDSQRGSGSPLDHSTRSTMEGAFGTNFEQVRVHTDSESDALNRSISAKAFTTGTDIFMRQDSSPTDHNLLAHELTHVVQQQSMAGSGSGMTVGAAGDSYEQQADAVASAVTSGQATPQRKADEQS